ncbi:MAG: hypothetical protein NE328_04675 [Lentisphaeraceae bacterium]|nr:hypothetical protein [Lentisphaeraceae bacterium]
MKKGGVLSVILFIFLGLRFFSSFIGGPDIDKVISNAVKSGNKELAKLSDAPGFNSGRCYRDGSKKGIVFEYVYSEDFAPEEIDENEMKAELMKKFKGNADIKKIGELGIHYKFIFKKPDGQVLCSVTISSSELEM